MKTCIRCKEELPLASFHIKTASKDGRQPRCKQCAVEVMQQWKKDNPEKYKETNRGRTRNLAKHGFTVEEWDQIVVDIDNKCQLCGKDMEKPCVDHDHNTGLVRGALCTHCNRGLGAFYDDPELLQKAIEFLANPPLAEKQIYSRHSMKAETPNGWLSHRKPRAQ